MRERTHPEMKWDVNHPELKQALQFCMATAAFNIFWFVLATPQQILTVLVKVHLGGSAFLLGALVGGVNLAGALNLVSVLLVGVFRERRLLWFWTTLFSRVCAFAVAGAAFWVAAGGPKSQAVLIVIVASVASSVGNSLGASAWWAWMGDLIPDSIRASFFGKRSALVQTINMVFFFLATLMIDQFLTQVFVVYGLLYLIAGTSGTLEVLTQIRAPDPLQGQVPKLDFSSFLVPLKDKPFRRFCLCVGGFLISFTLASPFLAPFVVDPKGAGATPIWLGIGFVVSQGTWVLMVPHWGRLMDSIGRRAVVVVGGFFVLAWIPYLFMGPTTYWYLIPLSALIIGLLAPAYWEGIGQFMITLSHPDHRVAYAGWFWTWFGLTTSVGPLLGGAVYDFLQETPLTWLPSAAPLQVLIVVAITFAIVAQLMLARMRTPNTTTDSVRSLLSTLLSTETFHAVTGNVLFWRRPPKG
ncbi:MAG: MFS transporter [Spirochaetales bacterium]